MPVLLLASLPRVNVTSVLLCPFTLSLIAIFRKDFCKICPDPLPGQMPFDVYFLIL
jgi:hypothetical protein